jgi:hypothetical protein
LVAVSGTLRAEVAGELVAEGVVVCSEASDFGPGCVEALAERVGAGPLDGLCGRRWWRSAEAFDDVAKLRLTVEPGAGDAGCAGDGSEADGAPFAAEAFDGFVGCCEGGLVSAGVGLGEEGAVRAGHRRGLD